MSERSPIPGGLTPNNFRSSDFGACTNCSSSMFSEPVKDERAPWGVFCTPGCLNDYLYIRMGLPRD